MVPALSLCSPHLLSLPCRRKEHSEGTAEATRPVHGRAGDTGGVTPVTQQHYPVTGMQKAAFPSPFPVSPAEGLALPAAQLKHTKYFSPTTAV